MIDAKPRPVSGPAHRPGSVGWIKSIALDLLGVPVAAMSAPGGKDRRSVRLNLEDGRSVIATRRDSRARAEHEANLLTVLHGEGAPVPEVLGFRDGLLLQADAGRNRLSYAMQAAAPEDRKTLAKAAIDALSACREAAHRAPGLVDALPGLGTRPGWAEEYVARSVFLSSDLKIAAPNMDAEAFAQSLAHRPDQFTRWDARLGNASVQVDGSVVWYDWDLTGRRAGVEDVSWLIADNYWGLSLEVTRNLLTQAVPDPEKRTLVHRMAVVVAIGRLAKIRERVATDGWSDPEEALRMDRLGAVPEVVSGLCQRMSHLCEGDPILEGFCPWFPQVARAMVGQSG